MVKFTVKQVRSLMDKKENVRNMSIIAHVDHGKSTLTDYLALAAGITVNDKPDNNNNEYRCFWYTEQDCVRIKSTGFSLYYELDVSKVPPGSNGNEFMINLIDIPRCVDFSSEIGSALRVTDGALVVVDCIEGFCVQTESVLCQALTERIKPLLMINKLDRVFFESMFDPEEAYQSFARTIETTNVVIATYEDNHDIQVSPEKGTVVFGSGLREWGFSLNKFAEMYTTKFGVARDRLVEKLWGDHFYDPKSKRWKTTKNGEDGSTLRRGFVQFILDPIYKLLLSIKNNEVEKYNKMLKSIGIELKEEDLKNLMLMKAVMRKFLPISEVLEMLVFHLPSPVNAQRYRVEYLYEGPMDDECATAIRNCDPNGPLMLYVSKLVPTTDKGRFYAFGRVFAGTIKTGQNVRILGPNYIPGKKTDLYIKPIENIFFMMGPNVELVEDIPAGNTVGIVGVDRFLLKSGTITTSEVAYNIRSMKFNLSPVVRVAVECKYPKDLPKFIEGLKRLSKSDFMVQTTIEESGEYIVAGTGELHLEICLNNLRQEYCGGIEIKISDPMVIYRETVTESSKQIYFSNSPNKHNQIYATAEPMKTGVEDMDNRKVDDDPKAYMHYLVETCEWDANDMKKIWCFGPDNVGPNILMDMSKDVPHLNEIKDSCVSAFQWATKEGVLCDEIVRGVRINLHDATLHADAIHRGGGQIIPTARRVFYAAMLMAKPAIMEPVYLVEIRCTASSMGGMYSVINRRRGYVFKEQKEGVLYVVKAYIPVVESFGFGADLCSHTSGQAFPQCVFDHWETLVGDPLENGSKPNVIVLGIRKMKGINEEIPGLDKLLGNL